MTASSANTGARLANREDTIEVALRPVSPLVSGAEGAVDLYLVPAYDDIASLYFESGRWSDPHCICGRPRTPTTP